MRLDVPAAATMALQYGWLGVSPLRNSFENIFSILRSLLKQKSVFSLLSYPDIRKIARGNACNLPPARKKTGRFRGSSPPLICSNACQSAWLRCRSLQIPWVMVPMGQNVHQVLGLKSAMTIRPISSEVSIRL